MRNRRRREWELRESSVTPEAIYQDRRALMRGLAAGTILAATSPLLPILNHAARAADPTDPSAHLYPVERNPRYTVTRAMTEEKFATAYNNFYEFGSHKNIRKAAQALKTRPWTVVLDGLVEKPMEIGIDDLLKKMPLEERVYRHRCVEAWSMVVPWSGFPLSELVKLAEPLSSAKYIRMETFMDPETAKGQKQHWYPWPYIEGLTIEEAMNDLAFIATGIYGKPMPRQNGAPLRLAVPWKYGFKSTKSIVRFTFTSERPVSFWEELQASEYGFWANVNPEVPHARWSQSSERPLGGGNDRIPTLLYNGYAEQVADLYKGMEGERLFT